jgi:predicted dehydrogenase
MLSRNPIRRFAFLVAFGLVSAGSSPIIPMIHAEQDARFRLAIVGLVHSHGWSHLRTMAKNSGIEVVGIADANADLRELAAKALPGVALYDDYRNLLDEKKPQRVWSFVENDRHLEITQACAARGIHVIFEKPMAATYQPARQMMDIAKKNRIQLMINYQMAWWPTNYAAYDFARSGDIGKVRRVRSIIGHGGPAPGDANDARGRRFWTWLNDE